MRTPIVRLIAALAAMSALATAALLSKNAATVVVVLTFILLAVLLILGYTAYRSRPEALTNEAAIADRLAELRADASTYLAMWSGVYDESDVARYFKAEQAALEKNKALTITRVVNLDALPASNHRVLQDMQSRFREHYRVFENSDVDSFELYWAAYPEGRESIAAVVLIDAINHRPRVGFVLDPNRDPNLLGAVAAVRQWYDQVLDSSTSFDPGAVTRWDHLAPRQTRYISQNTLKVPFLSRFVAQEQAATRAHIASLIAAKRQVTLIEVGCGDGRVALRYVPPALAPNVAYVIGVDLAPRMVNAAQEGLRHSIAMDDATVPDVRDLYMRTIFLNIDARTLGSFFEGGRLQDAEQLVSASPADAPPALDPTVFSDSQKVYCCLFNTLGTLDLQSERIELVEAMVSSLGVGDSALISAFDATLFGSEAHAYYEALGPYFDAGQSDKRLDTSERIFEIAGVPGYREQWLERHAYDSLLKAVVDSVMSSRPGRKFDVAVTDMGDVGWLFVIRRRT
jgi:hypothetical protein